MSLNFCWAKTLISSFRIRFPCNRHSKKCDTGAGNSMAVCLSVGGGSVLTGDMFG
jgi:hypothetical protein